jgi:hypothetical protein
MPDSEEGQYCRGTTRKQARESRRTPGSRGQGFLKGDAMHKVYESNDDANNLTPGPKCMMSKARCSKASERGEGRSPHLRTGYI